jgi:hypothetical protein
MRPAALLALFAFLFPSCGSISDCMRAKIAGPPLPPPAPGSNFFQSRLPDKSMPMTRVAMLPLSNARYTTQALRQVAEAFHTELSRKALFEIVPVRGTDLEEICGRRQISSVERIPSELFDGLRERFGAEGVLFTDITLFNPYRPVAIGVRAKLVDITSGAITWACDFVYDSGQPAVAETARAFQRQFSNPQRPIADDGGSVLISPARFAKFAACAAFSSLDNSSGVH